MEWLIQETDIMARKYKGIYKDN